MRTCKSVLTMLLVGIVAAAPASASAAHRISAQTQTNLIAAAHGEAYAHAKYWAYAQAAKRAGDTSVARLFLQTSRVELFDHFAKLARMAGIVRSNADNLRDAIAGEGAEAASIYPGFADQAKAQDNEAAAKFWTRAGRR